jgi:hypothetical protein
MLVLVYLEIELMLTQDGCMVSQNVPKAQKSFWMHPMVLLGVEAQVDARFGPFGDSTNLGARQVHGLRRTFHTLENHCWMHPMDLHADIGHVESHPCPFGDSVSVSAR